MEKGAQAEGVLTIPEQVNGYTVTAVDGLSWMRHITKVVFPDSVRIIESSAFDYDDSLAEAVLPPFLVSIGSGAFYDCALTSVEIPASVSYIGNSAFSCPQLETVTFTPGENLRIDGNPFVKSGIMCFSVPANHPNLAAYQGVLFDKTEKKLISFPSAANADTYTIPEGIRIIGTDAFRHVPLRHVTFPETVLAIEYGAFSYTELTAVTLPDSLQLLEGSAFANNENLAGIHLGNGLRTIDDFAFERCNRLSEIDIPENVRTIGMGVFRYCDKLTKITVSDRNPFYHVQNHCLIEKSTATILSFPPALRIDTLEIPDGVLTIGDEAFGNALIRHIVFPDSVRVINSCVFCNLPLLETVRLSSNLLTIRHGFCYGCDRLTQLTIPRSVGWIETSTFTDVPNLRIQVEAGSYAESYCRHEGIPFTCVSAASEAEKPVSPDSVLGFPALRTEDIRSSVSTYLQKIREMNDLPPAGPEAAFPGILSVREVKDFGKTLYEGGFTAETCPESMKGLWLIYAEYEQNYEVSGLPAYSTSNRCLYAGYAEQAVPKENSIRMSCVSFSRPGIMYSFKRSDDTILFDFCLTDVQDEIPVDSYWLYNLSSYIRWSDNTQDDGYSVYCIFNDDETAPENVGETVAYYTPDGECQWSGIQEIR